MLLWFVLLAGGALAGQPDNTYGSAQNYPYQPYNYRSNYPSTYANRDYPYNPYYPKTYSGYPPNNDYYNDAGYKTPYYNRGSVSPYYNNQQRILRYSNNNNGNGNYQFEYETENGIKQQEVGQLKHIDSPDPATVVQGSYSYVSPDGQTHQVNYVADENGFQPSGAHIPLQKSYLTNPNAAYRRYYNQPQYAAPVHDIGYKY